jgi:hypothetical protein
MTYTQGVALFSSDRDEMYPKVFYEMSAEKDQQAIITFLGLTALLYSLAATFFAREKQLIFLFIFFLNGFLMPFILAQCFAWC